MLVRSQWLWFQSYFRRKAVLCGIVIDRRFVFIRWDNPLKIPLLTGDISLWIRLDTQPFHIQISIKILNEILIMPGFVCLVNHPAEDLFISDLKSLMPHIETALIHFKFRVNGQRMWEQTRNSAKIKGNDLATIQSGKTCTYMHLRDTDNYFCTEIISEW